MLKVTGSKSEKEVARSRAPRKKSQGHDTKAQDCRTDHSRSKIRAQGHWGKIKLTGDNLVTGVTGRKLRSREETPSRSTLKVMGTLMQQDQTS